MSKADLYREKSGLSDDGLVDSELINEEFPDSMAFTMEMSEIPPLYHCEIFYYENVVWKNVEIIRPEREYLQRASS